ncbi:MAG: hypothetical protein ACYDH2_11010 [Anaerolineaceae bacterium]
MTDFEISHEEFEKKKGPEGWWEEKTLAGKILWGIGFGILGLAFIALCGWVVMLLWNWLMPDIFGLKQVNYWQAWGLFILSSLLFKGMGNGGHSPSSEKKRKQKLKNYIHQEHLHNMDSAE